MFDHNKINEILVKNGFERTESGRCWVNRLNGMVIYKGSYSPLHKSKTNYTICNGDKRDFIYSETELEILLTNKK